MDPALQWGTNPLSIQRSFSLSTVGSQRPLGHHSTSPTFSSRCLTSKHFVLIQAVGRKQFIDNTY